MSNGSVRLLIAFFSIEIVSVSIALTVLYSLQSVDPRYVLMGSLVAFFPAILFILHFLWARSAQKTNKMLRFFYQGGLAKFLCVGLTAWWVFTYCKVQVGPFLVGFFSVLVGQVVFMMLFSQSRPTCLERKS